MNWQLINCASFKLNATHKTIYWHLNGVYSIFSGAIVDVNAS